MHAATPSLSKKCTVHHTRADLYDEMADLVSIRTSGIVHQLVVHLLEYRNGDVEEDPFDIVACAMLGNIKPSLFLNLKGLFGFITRSPAFGSRKTDFSDICECDWSFKVDLLFLTDLNGRCPQLLVSDINDILYLYTSMYGWSISFACPPRLLKIRR